MSTFLSDRPRNDEPLLGAPVADRLKRMRTSLANQPAAPPPTSPRTKYMNAQMDEHAGAMDKRTGTFANGKFKGLNETQARAQLSKEFDASKAPPRLGANGGLQSGGLVTGNAAIAERKAQELARAQGRDPEPTRGGMTDEQWRAAFPGSRVGLPPAPPAAPLTPTATAARQQPGMFGAGPQSAPLASAPGVTTTAVPATDASPGFVRRDMSNRYGSGVGIVGGQPGATYIGDETGDHTAEVQSGARRRSFVGADPVTPSPASGTAGFASGATGPFADSAPDYAPPGATATPARAPDASAVAPTDDDDEAAAAASASKRRSFVG